jgi:chemotaxis protein CheD
VSEIRVKVADYAVGRHDTTIATIGLGSCIAIALYDPVNRVGGLAHILLPSISLSRDASNLAKFPETAVPMLLREMRRLGANGRITAKIAGGSSMFGSLLPGGGINMGERNIEATREALARNDVTLTAEDVGGDYGRSVYFDLASGTVIVKSLKAGERVL